jgi:hypothetical protein
LIGILAENLPCLARNILVHLQCRY